MLSFPYSVASYSAYSRPSLEAAHFPPVATEENYIDAQKVVKTSPLPVGIAKMIGLIKDLWFTIGTFFSRIEHAPNYGKVIGNKETAKGIVVLIHGLNGHASQMDGHAKAFKQKVGEDILIYQVQVDKKGNCSKGEAVQRITDTVLPLLQERPALKLYAHGISNGGWLASQLAVDAIDAGIQGERIMVNANSSPLYGTKVMCDPALAPWKQKIWKWLVQSPLGGNHEEVIYKDFSWGSEAGKQIIREIRRAAEQGVQFEFEGGFADSKVTPPSFYPKNVKDARYFHPNSIQGHSSIIASQRQRQVESACAFLSS
ncbi:alpha/beta hydrolase [Candidatus Protochlamydia phocaeensis]|uniref:alpha/beta hydrolase n=1 Tax=Candidatus Protochlamydia phocaeensis TaxID=1414722 RepID=UPI0008399568|nr:alpha/beta hydrolase [Candidatus Protochlamydia phocaeensis]